MVITKQITLNDDRASFERIKRAILYLKTKLPKAENYTCDAKYRIESNTAIISLSVDTKLQPWYIRVINFVKQRHL